MGPLTGQRAGPGRAREKSSARGPAYEPAGWAGWAAGRAGGRAGGPGWGRAGAGLAGQALGFFK